MGKEKTKLDYKDDLFFKFYCGKAGDESLDFRRFLIKNITKLNTDGIRIGNGEPVVLTSSDKKIIMDTFIIHDDYFLDMEMQNSTLNIYQSKRFQYYLCKNIVLQMMDKQKDYQKIKEFHLILFINREYKDKMIDYASLRYEHGDLISNCIVHMHIVNLKNIDRIAKERKLSEFEAVIYLMANNTLEGIDYEEKEGMVSYMKANYEIFGSDVTMMKRLLKEREEEVFRQMEMEESKIEGIGIGEERGIGIGRKEALVDLLCQTIQMKYQKDARDWLMKCEEIQLMEINKLLYENITYEELVQQFAFH